MKKIFWIWHKNRSTVSFICLMIMIALGMLFNLWTESDKHPIPFWACMALFIIHSIPYCIKRESE